MRTLARGNSISECKKAAGHLKAGGWTAITDIKVDDSLAYAGGDISYVIVMERPDDGMGKKHKWNNNLPAY